MYTRHILSVLLLGFSLASCKHNDDDPSPGAAGCRISTITESGVARQISYDDKGRVATVTVPASSGTTIDKYQYHENYAIVEHSRFMGLAARDSITWNSYGLMTSRYVTASSNPSYWYRQTFNYNDSGQLQSTMTANNSSPAGITESFTWANGNLMSTSNGESFEYDMSKPAAPGDFFSVRAFTNEGWPTIRTRNLPVTHITLSSRGLMRYTQDAEGRIIKLETMYVAGYGATRTVDFAYKCN